MTLILVLLQGCGGSLLHTGESSPTLPTATRGERAQHTVDEFVAAARRGDSAAVAALVSGRDQGFAGRAAVWAANLQRIDWSSLTWTVLPPQAEVPAARRDVLGPQAWVQKVDLAWALPGEDESAQEDVWLTFVEEPADGHGAEPGTDTVTRLAADADSPVAGALPLWLQQPVQLHRSGSVLLLGDPDDPAGWLRAAAAARRTVHQRAGSAVKDSDGVLVLEVPQSRAVFERALGVPSGSYATVAAAAWPMGSDTSNAPIHVLINPEASGRLSGLGRDVLLIHEAVHVATRSPGSPAPSWLVEGYADQIAYAAHPAGRVPAERSVRSYVRAKGVPDGWPAEDDLAPDAADLDLGYDLAWSAAHSIATAYGADGLNRFYAAVDGGSSVDEAAETIGTTRRALLRQWQSDLQRLAGERGR